MSLLNVYDTKIIDEQGKEVILRGAGLGGWMKSGLNIYRPMISLTLCTAWRTSSLVRVFQMLARVLNCRSYPGYPGCEHQIRDALVQAIGQKKSDFFFDRVRKLHC